ncbi:hypothetical protein JYQ62_21540 [Nostoc sp. UHCC 0702]|nr:hypothetical protein JYQ62_21540 [Nostoc sp. UHCC 0702]
MKNEGKSVERAPVIAEAEETIKYLLKEKLNIRTIFSKFDEISYNQKRYHTKEEVLSGCINH